MILGLLVLFIVIIINSVLIIRVLFYKFITYPKLIKSIKLDAEFRVNIFVPCKGWNSKLRYCLESIVNQDYDNYMVIFVTEDEKDGAVKEIKKLVKESANCKHVIAGKTTRCSQKNFNLLKGIEKFGNADIFVFCDSDVIVERKWLKKMVKPFNNKKVTATTSFDSSTNNSDSFLSTFKKMIDAYLLFLIMGVGALWGGSFAIRQKEFFRLGINNYWKNTCVDDISATKILFKNKKRAFYVPTGLKHIRSNDNFEKTFSWWVRQIMYSKYYLKGLWVLALINYATMSLPVLLFPLFLILSFVNNHFISYLVLSAAMLIFVEAYFVMVLFIKLLDSKNFQNKEKITLKTLAFIPLVFLVGFYSLFITIFKKALVWSGREYTLDSKGNVKSIKFK